jgi:putative nucleotidyltransferase with HDIG domain
MDSREQIRHAIKYKLGSLPTLPEVVSNILAMVQDERSTTPQLAGYIERDQAICSSVLRVANSAYYGSYRKVDSISQAIVVLGFEQVRSIALGTSVFARLGKGGSQQFDRRQFWLHSIGVATGAKLISGRRGKRDEYFFVCGLLHDVGKLMFDRHMAERYGQAIAAAHAERRPLAEVERERFGMDHAEVGFMMLDRWKLPQNIISGLHRHHDWEGNGSVPEAAKVVALADNLCIEAGLGASGAPKVGLEYLLGLQLGFSAEELRDLAQELAGSRDRMEGFLSALE